MLDKNDLLVISHLRKNARESLTDMSRTTKIPISTIYDKLKSFKKTFLFKNTCLVDFSELGFNTRAKVLLKVDRTQRQDFSRYLGTHQNVNTLYKINNGFDFMVEVIFRHLKDLEDFLEDIESKYPVKAMEVHYIIEDLKREAFLSDPGTLALVLDSPLQEKK